MELIRTRDPVVPLKAACEVLGVPLSTARRHLAPKMYEPRRPRPTSHRKLTVLEQQQILDTLHSDRFQDQPRGSSTRSCSMRGVTSRPRARCTESSRNTVRSKSAAISGRRVRTQFLDLRRAGRTRPGRGASYSKLATYTPGVFLNLYLVLDLFSRYPVTWMVAERENSALAKQMFAHAITRYELKPGTITVHNDRGAPMTSAGFVDLLAQLGVERSLSRPRVSNDNPYSESCFKTVKYQPDYPGRFQNIGHARRWLSEFFDWYANHHRHSGLALFTPADVFFGRVPQLAATRQVALDAAYAAHPERFVHGRPVVRLPPAKVMLNPIDPGASSQTAAALLSAENGSPHPTPNLDVPTSVAPGLRCALDYT